VGGEPAWSGGISAAAAVAVHLSWIGCDEPSCEEEMRKMDGWVGDHEAGPSASSPTFI